MGHPGRGDRPEEAGEAQQVVQEAMGPARPHAPEVDLEWPTDPPAPKPTPPALPLLLLTGAALTLFIALGRATLAAHPALFTLTFLVAGALSPDALPVGLLALLLIMDLSITALLRRTPTDRALLRAVRAKKNEVARNLRPII